MAEKPWNYNEDEFDEIEYDGTPIMRPSTKAITFTPGSGFGEAGTSDVDVQKKRIEKATKPKESTKLQTPTKKSPKKKTNKKV